MQKRKFGMKVYNVSQGAGGGYSHIDNKGNPLFHYDLNGGDTGISDFVAFYPFEVISVYKIETSGFYNTVHFYDSENNVTVAMTHDNNINDMYVGKILNIGEKMYDEGTAGNATGNHIHMEMAYGKVIKKTKINGVWTMPNLIPIEEYWCLDKDYTVVKDTKGHDLESCEDEKLEYTTDTLENKVYRCGARVNVRQVPLQDSGLVETIEAGDYPAKEVTQETTDSYRWVYIEYATGKFGWVALIGGVSILVDKETKPTECEINLELAKKELETLKVALEVQGKELATARDTITYQDTTITELKAQRKTAESTILSLKKDIEVLEFEKEDLKKQLSDLKSVDSYSAFELIVLGFKKLLGGE